MSEADDAYKAAQRLIAKALADGDGELDLNTYATRALTTLPPEIADLTGIRVLELNSTQVADLAPITGLTGITGLNFYNTQISDLTPIAGLTEIKHLHFAGTQVADLTPIAGMTGITVLDLGNTQVADLTPIASMTGIKALTLDNTQVADLTPITGMTGIAWLDLNSTLIPDLRPLLPLTKLADSPIFQGLTFQNTPATALDPKLAELSEILDNTDRATKTFAYLRKVGDDWPPSKPSTPADRPSAAIYTFPTSGPVKSIDEPPTGGDQDQDDLREDLKQKVTYLIEALGRSNELGLLREQAEHYQARLSATPIRIKLLWAAANALRQAYEKDERAEVTARNTDLLPPKVSAALGDVVETHALFIMGFDNAAALEQQMRDGLTGSRNPEQLAAGTAIVAALDNRPDAIDADDFAALSDDATAAQGVGDSAEMAENDLGNRLWNLLGAAGRKARVWLAMGTKGGGAALLGHDFIQFLLGNETLIMTYLRLAQGRAAEWFPKLLEAIRALLGL